MEARYVNDVVMTMGINLHRTLGSISGRMVGMTPNCRAQLTALMAAKNLMFQAS